MTQPGMQMNEPPNMALRGGSRRLRQCAFWQLELATIAGEPTFWAWTMFIHFTREAPIILVISSVLAGPAMHLSGEGMRHINGRENGTPAAIAEPASANISAMGGAIGATNA